LIQFIVLTGTPAAIDRLAPHLRGALESTARCPGELTEHIGRSRTWAAAGISLPDPTGATRLVADDDAMVVMNGPALAAKGDQLRLAEGALQAFKAGGSAEVSRTLGGAYNFVGAAPGHGTEAYVDFSGLFPLYWHQGADFAVFSNRSATIGRLAGRGGWDLRAMAWLVGHGNLFGDDMPTAGVRYLPPGRQARVGWGRTDVQLSNSPAWVWPSPADDAGRANLSSVEWDEITADLVDNFRALAAVDWPLHLFLTGGKDSRLCLALAKAAGLEERIATITNGSFDSPEVEVAALVAKTTGFSHERLGPPATMPAAEFAAAFNSPHDPQRRWRQLPQQAYRHDSIVSPWDGMTDPLRGLNLGVKGFGGEFYRRTNAKRFRRAHLTSLDTMAKMFIDFHQPHDPLGVLRPSESAFQDEWLTNWVHQTAKEVRFDLLPEKFYVDYRLGHWNGPMGQATPTRIVVNPLVSARAATKSLELSLEARGQERFHYEVMRRAAPELVSIPFLGDTWAEEIAADSSVELPRQAYPVTVQPTAAVLQPWQWLFLGQESKAIRRLFSRAAGKTAMNDICDMRKFEAVAERSSEIERVPPAKAVFSGICIALSLLGEVEPFVDHAPPPAWAEAGRAR
jgi:hypothetical protein